MKWTYLLQGNPLFPHVLCASNGPQWWQVPQELRGLTVPEVCLLSPLIMHQGDVEKNSRGYARHSTITRSSWKQLPMEERLKLPLRDRQLMMTAHEFLMFSTESTFADFERREGKPLDRQCSPQAFTMRPTLECALFPDLFPFGIWCDTVVQVGSHLSVMESLCATISRAVIDYAADHRLHQYYVDKWQWSTVTAA